MAVKLKNLLLNRQLKASLYVSSFWICPTAKTPRILFFVGYFVCN